MDPSDISDTDEGTSFVVINPDGDSVPTAQPLLTEGGRSRSQRPTLPPGVSREMYEMNVWQTEQTTPPPSLFRPASLSSTTAPNSRRDSGTPQYRHGDPGQAARSYTTAAPADSGQYLTAHQPRSQVFSRQTDRTPGRSSASFTQSPSYGGAAVAGSPGSRPTPSQRAYGSRDGAGRSMRASGDSLGQGRQAGGPDLMRSVLVRGVSDATSEGDLLDYLESRRRSGGGEVVGVDIVRQQGQALVTFLHPEDAANVCDPSRRHALHDTQLTIGLHRDVPPLPHCLKVSPLPDSVSTDQLSLFAERYTGHAVDKILYGHVGQDESAVIFFKDNIDVSAARAALAGQPFGDGATLSITTLPSRGVILVRQLPPGVSDETLVNYFENRRVGAGQVTKVDIRQDDNGRYALVSLQDHQEAPVVAARRHTFDQRDMDVSLYLDCLGPGGGAAVRQLNIPAPVLLREEDRRKVSALLRVPEMQREWQAVLSDRHATLSEGGFSCTVTAATGDARRILRTWERDVRQAAGDYLHTVHVTSTATSRQEFTEAEPLLRQKAARAEGQRRLAFFYDDTDQETRFVHDASQSGAVRDMEDAIRAVRQRLDRENRVKRETVTVPGGELELLDKAGVREDIKGRFPQMEIIFDVGSSKVIMTGVDEEVRGATQIIADNRRRITWLKLPYHQLPYQEAARLLRSAAVEKIIRGACLEENPKGVVRFRDNLFSVYAFDKHRAERMQEAGVRKIQRKEFQLGEADRTAFSSGPVSEALTALETRHGELTLVERRSASHVVLVSVHPDFLGDVRRLETALEENSTRPARFHMEATSMRLLNLYFSTGRPQGSLRSDRLQFDSVNSVVTATCTRQEEENYSHDIAIFSSKIVTETLDFDQPSFKDFITSQQGQNDMTRVEVEKKCVIRVDDLDAGGAQGGPPLDMGWDGLGTVDGQQPAPRNFQVSQPAWADPDAAAETTEIPAKPRLFVRYMHDIINEEQDVLVNSSNQNLNLEIGQVSRDLLRVGGQKLQDDCIAKYPKGIKIGDIAVTGPGRTREDTQRDRKWRLQCKNIYHCCLPVTRDEETMKRVVKEAVTKCLTLADRSKMSSISFPALGAGTLKYPIALVASTMFQAALEYGRNHRGMHVSDVYFVVHKKDTDNTQAFEAEEQRYKASLAERDRAQKAENYMLPVEREEGQLRWQFFEKTRGRVVLSLSALRRQDITDARDELVKAYDNQTDTRAEKAHRLAHWDQSFIDQVVQACKAHNMDVTFNFDLGRLNLRGFRSELMHVRLSDIIRQAEAEVAERENANLMSRQVQWCWVEVDTAGRTSICPYDAVNSYRIEKAYLDEDRLQATVYDKNKVPYRVDFTRMKEIPEWVSDDEENPECLLDVIRRDVKTELTFDAPIPEDWSGNTTLGMVRLTPGNRDYDRVAQRFKDSLQRPGVNIVSIDRVENLTVYKQYMALRRHMSSRYVGEKEPLWHGTQEDTVASITRYGFNRSYCQRNVYGQGVYFAKRAEKACEEVYATTNAAGERRVFYCKVLVGDSVKGKPEMRVLPKKPHDATATYDSAVDNVDDPSIFVVFKDAQAYPMYLIVFKDN